MHHRALDRAAEVAAGALGDVALVRVGVTALRALEAFLGRLEVALEAAHEAVVDRGVGAQVADADVVGVIPHGFERLRVVLQARVLAVVDEAAGSVVREVLLVAELLHRGGLQPHRVVEGVGVEVVVSHAFDTAELFTVHAVEAVGQGFSRSGVHGIVVALRFAPLLAQLVHALDDGQRELLAFRIPAVVANPVLAVEDRGGLGKADVAERHGGTLVLEQLVHVVVGTETTERTEAEQGRGVDRGGFLAAHDAELQRLMGHFHALLEQLPEAGLVAVGFDGDTRHVDGDHAEVHTAIFFILAGLRVDPTLQEGAATHRSLEGACDLDDVLVEHHIRVHALGGGLEGELLQIVVRVTRVGVHAVLHSKDELREDGGVVFLAEAANTVQQDCALHFTREPVGAETKADSHERGLAVGHTVGVDLVFHGLHGIIDGLAGTNLGEDFTLLLKFVNVGVERGVHRQRFAGTEMQLGGLVPLGALDLTTGEFNRHAVGDGLTSFLEELLVILLGILGKMLVGTVGGLATILAGGHVLHDLGNLGGRNGDGLRGSHRSVAKSEAIGQHVPEVRQGAVGLGSERRVVGIVEVNVALHVGVGHRRRQHVERGGLGHGTGQQITLGGVDVGILVRVLVNQGRVVVDEAGNGLVDISGLGTLNVLVETVVGVGASHIVQVGVNEGVLHEVLNVLDLGGAGVTPLDFAFDLVGETTDHGIFFGADFLVQVTESRLDRRDDVDGVEVDHTTITLLNEHGGGLGGHLGLVIGDDFLQHLCTHRAPLSYKANTLLSSAFWPHSTWATRNYIDVVFLNL